jgi:hypothetical protein
MPRQRKSLTLAQIVAIADKVYPDGLVAEHYKLLRGDPAERDLEAIADLGDTLAEFIVKELKDAYNSREHPADQLFAAKHAMERASDELDKIIEALGDAEAKAS